MALQFATSLRNGWLDFIETHIGTAPKLQIRSGSPPANCAAAASGTLLCEITLPSDWMAAASGGSKAKTGTWQGTAAATGTAGHYRILDSGGTTCFEQGTVTQAFVLTTSDTTPNNNQFLTFTSTTGVTVGMQVRGTGVTSGSLVHAVPSGTSVELNALTTGVANGTDITFGDTSGDLALQNISIVAGQAVTITSKTMVAPGA